MNNPKSEPDLEQQPYLYTTAIPIVSNNSVPDIPDHVIKCYQLAKTVMLFAMIDIIFGVFYAFFSFYYLIPLLIAIYGYYSAKKYNSGGVLCYTIYQVVINIIRLGLAIYSYVLIRQDNTITDYTMYNFYIVLSVLTTLLGLYIARFGYRLYKSIQSLTDLERDRLIFLNYPVRIIYW